MQLQEEYLHWNRKSSYIVSDVLQEPEVLVNRLCKFLEQRPAECTTYHTAVLQELKDLLHVYATDCRDRILAEASFYYKREALCLYIEHLQARFTNLANKVYHKLLPAAGAAEHAAVQPVLLQLIETVFELCDMILGFAEQHYRNYFNVEQFLPDHALLRYQKLLIKEERKLRKRLPEQGFDALLTDMALQPLKLFTEPFTHQQPVYKQLYYVQFLVQHLTAYTARAAEDDGILLSAERLLIVLGLNHNSFITYLLKKIRIRALSLALSTEKEFFWHGLIRELKLLAVSGENGTTYNGMDVLQRLIDIAEDELRLLMAANPTRTSTMATINPMPETVCTIKIPVAQLAVLLRILVDEGVIIARNQTAFLKQLCSVVEREGMGLISAESLRNKYYAPEQSSLTAVKDLLFVLIKRIQKM